ncbi:MAG TPA: uroporphyrinogen-III C-methyltransferase [Geminicoccaceae bacterium]|nr:uroporphyrinogen-III C-methyltransferase [Geminicoccus sp.]HMU50655.1 uroporphyrinogen-III C-methyltransferase [Geminicoccaceae bacterium]
MHPPLVYLVGAGPGDADLLTLRAARLLQIADIVVHDRLVGDGVLKLCNDKARRIDVGKAVGRHVRSQDEINDLLVASAAPDRVVVRLKGGDPFVFGRGGEEAIHLLRHGIRVEVVPGVTAALGCAAAAGIPLTHRGLARSVRFVTGHCRADEPLDLDWAGLADTETTLVVYMGHGQIATIAEKLVAHGLGPATPVAAITDGCDRSQRIVRTTLAQVAAASAPARPGSPTLFIIGAVVDVVAHGVGLSARERLDSRLFAPVAGHG